MNLSKYILPDKIFLKWKYKRRFGKKLDLKQPKTFNEKMQWLKLFERTPLHTLCADKYAVREYIKAVIGGKYLIPLLYHTQDFKDIKPENLPDIPFIIKTNHDSAGSIVIKSKKDVDWETIRKHLKKKLSRNFYYTSKEWQYKHITPSIIVETLLEDKNGELPEFSLHCFNGKVKLICGYIEKNCTAIFYDMNWEEQPPPWVQTNQKKHRSINRPKTMDEMIHIAKKLSSPFSYARIDFYDIDGKIYCGEITFHHIAGFQPFQDEAMNIKLGNMITLPYEQNKGSLDI